MLTREGEEHLPEKTRRRGRVEQEKASNPTVLQSTWTASMQGEILRGGTYQSDVGETREGRKREREKWEKLFTLWA
jgi:hypothetical protein